MYSSNSKKMDFPDFSTKDGVLSAIVVFLLWIWRTINGDIKAAKQAAEIVAASAITKEQFKEFLDSAAKGREEYLAVFKDIFQQMKEHSANDNAMFLKITESLARLEERSRKRYTDKE